MTWYTQPFRKKRRDMYPQRTHFANSCRTRQLLNIRLHDRKAWSVFFQVVRELNGETWDRCCRRTFLILNDAQTCGQLGRLLAVKKTVVFCSLACGAKVQQSQPHEDHFLGQPLPHKCSVYGFSMPSCRSGANHWPAPRWACSLSVIIFLIAFGLSGQILPRLECTDFLILWWKEDCFVFIWNEPARCNQHNSSRKKNPSFAVFFLLLSL